ncbi:protein farnesyltransferase subunit beta [Vigna unguiculata]|uniref:Protein farnesyltransferase subunit beta n=1 Tax=Vigna unguiculata TaxID=3917 RepID=A0A4D6M3R9_VIGUN|nr:protein farnesyltransferase subunit beta [Vigna unguiculata]
MKERCLQSLLSVSGDTMSEVSEKETNPPATEAAPPCPTVTQRDQWMVESQVFQIYHLFATIPPNAQTLMLELQRDNHVQYLSKGLRHLSSAFSVLDSKDKLHGFLRRMKQPNGGFRMHDDGEIDVRACYTAISVASIVNILDDELIQNVGDYILSCQTYEGGIGGEPGSEAHGGYTFCGLAAMILIGEASRLDLPRLIDWVVCRQGKECGFQGRTNKLVDGCYSFWQGGAVALLQRLYSIIDKQMEETSQIFNISNVSKDKESLDGTSTHATCYGTTESGSTDYRNIAYKFINEWRAQEPLFHSIALQQYILLCAQEQEGGLRDKPGKRRDHYHTCYCLSGLSLCQYSWSKHPDSPPLPKLVLGPYSNLLEPIHPLFNVVLERYREAHEFFFTES